MLGVVQVRYRYRIYPTPGQQHALARVFGCARVVYNDCLRLRDACYAAGEKISDTEVQRQVITLAKLTPERAWLGEVASVAVVSVSQDARRAYKNWFDSLTGRRKGPKIRHPRPRRKHGRQSIRLTRNGFALHGGRLYLAKVGDIKVEWSRSLPSVPSSVTVIRDPDGRYYASFVVERHTAPLPASDREATFAPMHRAPASARVQPVQAAAAQGRAGRGGQDIPRLGRLRCRSGADGRDRGGQGEYLEDVAVRAVALDRFGTEVAAAHAGAEHLDAGSGTARVQGSRGQYVEIGLEQGDAVHERAPGRGGDVLDDQQQLNGALGDARPGQRRGQVLTARPLARVHLGNVAFVFEAVAAQLEYDGPGERREIPGEIGLPGAPVLQQGSQKGHGEPPVRRVLERRKF